MPEFSPRCLRSKNASLVSLALVAMLVGCDGQVSRVEEGQQPELVEVARGDVVRRLRATGKARPVRSVGLRSRLGGIARTISVEAGDFVEAGQVVAVLDVDPAEHIRYLTTRVAVMQDSLQVRLGREEVRLNQLYVSEGHVSERELQVSRAELEVAEARLDLDRRQLQLIEKEGGGAALVAGGEVSLRAPVAGAVLARRLEEGEIVRSAMTTPGVGRDLFEIGDFSAVVIHAKVDQMDVNLVRVGAPVLVGVEALSAARAEGTVAHVAPAPAADARDRVEYDVRVRMTSTIPGLRAGMTCRVDLVLDERRGVLTLPVESVRRRSDGTWETLVPEGSKYRSVAVELGLRDERRVEVISGLSEGQNVRRHPVQDAGPALPDPGLLGRMGG